MTAFGYSVAAIEEALSRCPAMTSPAFDRARRLASTTGERIEKVSVKLGLVPEAELVGIYGALLGTPPFPADAFPDSPLPLGLTPRFLRHARVLPVSDRAECVEVAMVDPFDTAVLQAVEFALQRPVRPRVAVPAELEAALARLYGTTTTVEIAESGLDEAAETDLDRLRDLASEAPVIRLVNQMIIRAVESRASDIHIEATDGGIRVRIRIDGVLREAAAPPPNLRSAIVSRIKIMARLDIAERRLAQDGRIRMAVRGRDIDFRVSTTPSVHGESVVLRILDRGQLKLEFAALGFDPDQISAYMEVLRRPHGILLVTGPTGSGKTTTLYASLAALNATETKILTVEDPVEYLLPGVIQVQVKPQIGLTFASALRSFLRQDPDILMIGEIRDLETAQIAVQSALTGHLVLSTVHTNDAASAVTRLLDMGMEDYLLTSTINGIVGQRLVRTLCTVCREAYDADAAALAPLGSAAADRPTPVRLFRATGCTACAGTGFVGRTTILELLPMSDAVRRLVLRHAEAREIQAQAVDAGMRTMFQHGAQKVLAGLTTIEEVTRAVRDA